MRRNLEEIADKPRAHLQGVLKVKGPKPTTEVGLYLECSRRTKEDPESGSCHSLWDECKEVLEVAAGQMGGFKGVVSPGGSGISIIVTAALSLLPLPSGLRAIGVIRRCRVPCLWFSKDPTGPAVESSLCGGLEL